MDFEKLVPFIKKALENNGVSIQDIQEELQEGVGHPADDKDQELETIDNTVVDNSNPQKADVNNEEGKMLESTFKEIEVEEAINRAKEEKDFKGLKQGSYWDKLAAIYARTNSRENSTKA